MKIKQLNLAKRKEYFEILKKEIEMIESYSPQTAEERIIHEYAIEGSVTVVANKLNEAGWRIDGRKYTSNDISAVLKQKPKDEFHQMVKKAFEHNKAG
ncbi:hypothetical protein [Paenibacillus sp. OAS669]|uniref:hypothetical protein n=1 Tax=Paenibacillus sp. OAS669 TaxID=2663821 RepID=UPI001789C66C|nr:hypothetical protein [Paenibacillus sp. OAS669]MBE1444322.1 uncharacterized protein YqeY [Paenibacillus sp. OAS669]